MIFIKKIIFIAHWQKLKCIQQYTIGHLDSLYQSHYDFTWKDLETLTVNETSENWYLKNGKK